MSMSTPDVQPDKNNTESNKINLETHMNQQFPPQMQTISKEELAERRRKDLATLKASTQLLKEAREWADKSKMDDSQISSYNRSLEQAIRENEARAQQAGVTQDDLDKIEYSKPSQMSVERYNAYLKKRGKTHEEVARKDIATSITYAEKGKKDETRRRRRKRIDGLVDAEIERVENEDALMNSSRVKDEVTDIQKEVERRRNSAAVNNNDIPLEGSSDNLNESDGKHEPSLIHKTADRHDQSFAADYVPFDAGSIEQGVVWDRVPLPSKGQCYKHKLTHIEVAELTADDENLLIAPQMYRDGKILDTILERKILNKNIKPSELCKGDRDALLVWLRMSYGPEYPIYATNPETGKRYETIIRLDQFDYKPFGLQSDENGHFVYTTSEGDVLKFKFLTYGDEEELRNTVFKNVDKFESALFHKDIENLRMMSRFSNVLGDKTKDEIKDCLDDLTDILSENGLGEDTKDDKGMPILRSVTEQMLSATISVNGVTDREHIKDYINKMRAGEARKYRLYIADNTPGVDFRLKVNIPESDGGGSFDTFFRLENTFFVVF